MKFKVQSLTEVWKDTKLYCLGLVAVLGIVVGSVFSYQTVVKPIASSFTVQKAYAAKDDEGEAVDMSYSFYDMTSWLSAYYNAASSPDGWRTIKGEVNEKEYAYHSLLTQAAVEGARNQDKTNKDKWTYADKTWVNGNSTNIGGGGALLGFPDPITLKGKILGFFASKTSSSTVDYSYDSLSSVESATYNSLETYAYYGAALDALGIDASIGSGLSGFHPIRMAAGAIVWIGYILASAAELLFKVVISILQVTNPFNWFAQGFDFAWSQAGDNGLLSGLTSMVSGMYKLFANFGWVVMIPLTVATLIFMFIFTGNGRQNSGLTKSKAAKFRYFIVYFIFLSVGVPIMGTAYTAGLNALGETFNSNNVGNGSTSVDNVIFSAYVDNKSWIENNRMYLPKDVPLVWSRKHSDVTNGNKANVRQYALSINSLNHGKEIGSITDNSSSSWNINDKSSSKNKTSEGVNALLLRYMISSSYPASNWENLVKAKLTEAIKKDGSGGGKDSLVNRMSASATELSSKKGYQYLAYVNPHVQEGGSGVEIKEVEWWKLKVADYKFGEFPNIFLSKGFADNGVGGITSKTAKGANGVKEGQVELVANPYVEVSPSLVYGKSKATMSYLEMFNYLNSKFYSNKVSVYSTNALASNFSRDSHAEVNQVGAGYVHKFMIWLNTVALLFGIAFLAIGYALSMLISSFKRYTNLIMSIFMGTMGMQKAMVRSASGTIMLIFEVVGTLVTYEIVKTIYMSIPDILSSAIASLNGGSKVTTTILTQIGLPVAVADLGGFVLVIFSLIVSVIILVWALLMFLRIRKPIIDMADATFTSLIAKLFYADADLGKGEDGKGGSTGMNSGLAAAGAAGASFLSNIDGDDGDDNTGFVDGDNEEHNEDEETETGEDGEPKDKEDGDPKDEETPRPDEREANSKKTEELGEDVKEKGGVDRSQGKDGKSAEGKDGKPTEANSESPEAGESSSGQQGEDGMSAEEAAQAAEIAKANSQKPSASGSGKEGSGSGKQGSESKGVTSVSDDDTVNVEASSETPAEHESEKPSMGTLSPEIPGEKGSGKDGASGKQGDGVKPTSESGKLEKGVKTDSTEQLAKQGAIEAAKELASHADREAQSNGASGSQKQVTSGKTLEGRGSGNQSSVSPAESGKHAPQSGQEHSTSPQGAISPAESGRSSGSGSSSAPTRSQQHRQQAKVEAIGARESANQAKADAISSARDAGQGTRNVASGVGSIAAGVTAMATGDASGKAMVGQGVQQTIEGAKQLGSSISSGVSSVKNTAASVGQGVSAVANAGASVGTAIADSKVGQATGKVASKVGSVAGAGAAALGGAVLDATLEGAGMQPIARRVNGSTPASSAGTVTSTVTTTTTSGGAGGATTTTTVTSQTQAGSGGGNQQAQSSGGVLRRVGNHVENEVRQSLADMAPGAGISNGGTTTVQRQAGSKGAQGTTVVNTTTTSSSGSQGVANQTVRVTSTGQSNGGSTPVTTTTTSNGGSNQTVQKQVTSQGGQNGTVIVNTTTTTSGQPPVQKPTTGGGSGRGPVGDGHGYQPEQRQTPSSGGLGQTTHTTTTTTSVILNRGGDSGPRNVSQSKGNILKKAGEHVESEVHKALADMGGTAKSNANGEDIANDFMERMKREDLKKARKKRFNRPK